MNRIKGILRKIPYIKRLKTQVQVIFFRQNSPARDYEQLTGLMTVLPHKVALQANAYLPKSKAQLLQDIFVLSEMDFKRTGFFVEIGAADGINLSNSYLLEQEFGWTGILSEPARIWHKKLKINRPNAQVNFRCLWSRSNELITFNETQDPVYSTIDSLSSLDNHRFSRKYGKKYEVSSISLNDLLEDHDAPRHIDYLSIDTEGSEYEILKSVDFEKYTFSVITCEHNFAPQRELIYELLTSHGYRRLYEEVSEFDDWYVLKN